MVSKTLPELPIIDLTIVNVKPGSSSWISTCKRIREALEDYGCFVAIYDKVSFNLHNEVFSVIQKMFELPPEVKARNISNIPYHGYYKPGPIMPLLESFGIEDVTLHDKTQSFTNLLWPHGNQPFCEAVHEYAKQVSELERMVTKMVFESYGVEKYLDSHLNSTTYLLRIAKYGAPQEEEGTIGGVAHTDKNFITILHQNDVDGLEVQTKDGHWVPYEAFPHSFVVMAGEVFLAWSNNRVHAPLHRVTMKGNKPRYSVALFSRSKDTIETPKELVDDEHPLLFKPFDYMRLLKFYTEDVTRMAFCTIRDYCGV
ncbi:hypothetical protein Cgig2_018027 [Carnegiea gigantea]|uniref:Fe2OG dioxygenase domain-containing protein n=1 Tax=Carnegiea gigantea TaxID=171969 RepID=A0A9Q1JYK6_9CARY|nr:hypothetical protein Cgig2_018027 [Carnegiea gigantea]